jgi:hypothetical protein
MTGKGLRIARNILHEEPLIKDAFYYNKYKSLQEEFHNKLKKKLESFGYEPIFPLRGGVIFAKDNGQELYSEKSIPIGKDFQQYFIGEKDVINVMSGIAPRTYKLKREDYDIIVDIISFTELGSLNLPSKGESLEKRISEVVDSVLEM